MPDTLLNVLVALLYATTQKMHYFTVAKVKKWKPRNGPNKVKPGTFWQNTGKTAWSTGGESSIKAISSSHDSEVVFF